MDIVMYRTERRKKKKKRNALSSPVGIRRGLEKVLVKMCFYLVYFLLEKIIS